MENYIANENIKIYLQEEIVEGASSAILLIHGFCEHSGRYSEFIEKLKENGFSVFAMDLRGHGRTISKKGDLKSIDKVVQSLVYIKVGSIALHCGRQRKNHFFDFFWHNTFDQRIYFQI